MIIMIIVKSTTLFPGYKFTSTYQMAYFVKQTKDTQ